ncbi:hypothetical protein Kpol_1020p21 [Vanderwaltozyma polyspora DSM 70294]|uniref:polynucleotide adenylyltransferase n=1 Tax=Vanderwaltozyma polyspora (strain ATCC 22028 / DSM 70294 / BCRC 21397 / CBS 2163 / NBRC 10782 / NRRL Y-8283 / UCD 57-17) TaxID=436907 RepID=A7TLD2_VANPO|nr:uncharacterized protein Kpol_1020p21 [Vanderwaltozyma polyspora DSM 70294]EDO16913.1 hypothetical protein Kpol_1020p21 [Vanderwaltozyma polyspora DSM 70294]
MSKKRKLKIVKPKKLRKSSINKIRKNFNLFNEIDDIDNYDKLIDMEKSNNNRFLVLQDTDGIDKIDEIPIVDIESDTSNDDIDNLEDSLKDNNDFIAVSSTSEEDYDDISEDEDTDGNESSHADERTLNTEFPWLLNHDHSKQKEIIDWLTLEIKDFVAYISPSKEEIEIRNVTISKIRNSLKELWSDSDLHVFGSYATDLYLPSSDIDCVVNSENGDKENRNDLYSLATHFKRNGLAIQVEVIAKARVPIIKFVEPNSKLHIDISFERLNGLEVAKIIREWLDDTPGLRELVLIVKQFLAARRLNNVHTGGLGGLSIICLVYSFLKLHPRIITNDIDPIDNLGVLLIDFFELYGKNFAYDDVAISFLDGRTSYMPKSEFKQFQPVRNPFSLAIQDPNDPYNNISRGSFNLRDIKKAFSGAFDLLTNVCFEMDFATFKDRVGRSILGNVIKYRGEKRDFKDERDLIENAAILTNEEYHRKRSRIVHEDIFLDTTDSEPDLDEEQDMYHIDIPVPKKRKVQKERTINPAILLAQKRSKLKSSKSDSKSEKPNKKKQLPDKFIDSLMGIVSDDEQEEGEEGKNSIKQKISGHSRSKDNKKYETTTDYNSDEEKIELKKKVDAQTRRDYWLSKGQSMSTIATT